MNNPKDNNTKVFRLRPYQSEFIRQVTDAPSPARFFLAMVPGAGKSATLAILVNTLKRNKGVKRCLVIAPSPLMNMWHDQIARFGGMAPTLVNSQAYRRLQAETSAEINPWVTVQCGIVSIDFIKRKERLEEMLSVGWDIVILDEVHRCSEMSLRGVLARAIWQNTRIPYAVAATATPESAHWLTEAFNTTSVEWGYEDLVQDGVIPLHHYDVLSINLSDSESLIDEKVRKLLGSLGNLPNRGLLARNLLRRWYSSPYALEMSLRRLLSNSARSNRMSMPDEGMVDAEDIEQATIGAVEDVDVDRIKTILSLLEELECDSKWDRCINFMKAHEIAISLPCVIISRFTDTVQYLESLVGNEGTKCFAITTALSAEERENILCEARTEPAVLIATPAALDMGLVIDGHIFVYDCPLDKADVLRMLGFTLNVTGRKTSVYCHFLNVEGGEQKVDLDALLVEFFTSKGRGC